MLDIVKAIAREAGSVILSALHQPTLVHEKISYADLVTDTDKQVEDLIKSRILAKFPNHKIIAEESAENRSILTSEPTWIIDPIDGTSNFVSKFPFCAVCIGYYSEKQAKRDKGAFLNDQRIRVSGCTQLHNALILTDWGGDRNASNLDTKAANMRCLIAEARGVRTMGSAALHMCQVAAGQGDAFFEFGIHCWDYAASSLIVTEAGGYCCNIDGRVLLALARDFQLCSHTCKGRIGQFTGQS
ncbi:unnamed protein product [Mesocestoides corti]|uniref:Inositol-1-monophosphatase n=1 Tax=Mesocestoides corti TaxID=53468 RepID=A0A158QV33_MESCO|nr:unnamed protein product [Mesocestoides corti]